MEKKNIRVLITGGGTATAISVLKGLRIQNELNAHIIMADMDPLNAGRFLADDFVQVPGAKDPAFLNTLVMACRDKNVQMLVPIVDYEFEVISRNVEKFEQFGCKVIVSSVETIEISNDKFKTHEFLTKHGFPTPRIYSLDEIKTGKAQFPLFIKPALEGRASIDAHRVENMDELLYYVGGIENPLIQDCCEGQEYTIDVLNNLEHKCIAALARKRIETKGGLSVKGTVVKNDEITKLGRMLAEKLKIIGPCNIQGFELHDKRFLITEINPRFSGTLALSLGAGLNTPLLLTKMVLGMNAEPQFDKINYNITMARYWNEVYIDAKGRRFTLGFYPELLK